MTILTEENFEAEVLKSEIPVLVDFFATWCGPCRALAPIFESASEKLSASVKFCKADVDKIGAISVMYNVMSVPTLMLFKNGEAAARQVGVCTLEDIENMVK